MAITEAAGSFVVNVKVDPNNTVTEANENNNSLAPMPISVYETAALKIGMVRFSGCDGKDICYPAVSPLAITNYLGSAANPTSFMESILPVRNGGIDISQIAEPAQVIGSSDRTRSDSNIDGPDVGMAKDIVYLENIKRKGHYSRMVGVYSNGYIGYHFSQLSVTPQIKGFTIPTKAIGSAMILEGSTRHCSTKSFIPWAFIKNYMKPIL